MKHVLLTLTALGLATTSFAGGPWLWNKKTGFVQMQINQPAYKYNSLLIGGIRETQPINRFVYDSDYSIYGEHGITDKFNVMMKLPFKYVSSGVLTNTMHFANTLPSGSLFGLGNVEIGAKYGILNKKAKAAISVQTTWNTSRRDIDKGLSTGYDANSVGLTLHYGGSLSDKLYTFGEVGYKYYSNNFSDVIDAHLEMGYKLSDPFTFIFNVDIRQSLNNGSNFDERRLQTGLYANNQEWIVGSIKFMYETDKNVGATLGVPLVPVKFKNIGFAGAINFGVFKKF